MLRQTRLDLTDQIGGDPSPAQALIIQSAAVKATRLFLLSDKLLSGGEIGDATDHNLLAWLNSLRLDLMALGLERRLKDVTPTLAEILRSHNDGKAEIDAEPVETDEPRSPRSTPPRSKKRASGLAAVAEGGLFS